MLCGVHDTLNYEFLNTVITVFLSESAYTF